MKIGIGQLKMPGLGEKPIVTSMNAQVLEAGAPEIITVWLTTPPSKQVVFAVGRQLDYDQNKPLLKSNVINNLRQKYGQETDGGPVVLFWGFDEAGRRLGAAEQHQNNCQARAHFNLVVAPPTSSAFDYVTPLLYSPGAPEFCDSTVKVTAQLDGASGLNSEYTSRITVMVIDQPMALRSQQAYQAYLKSADAARQKEELEKAKQRKGPDF